MYSKCLRQIFRFIFFITVSITAHAAQDGDAKLFLKLMECSQGTASKLKSTYLKDKDFGVTVLLTLMIPDKKTIATNQQIPQNIKATAFSIPTGERKRMLMELLTNCDSVLRTTKPSTPILQQLTASYYSGQLELMDSINSESFELIQIMQLKKANEVSYEPIMKKIMTPDFMTTLSDLDFTAHFQKWSAEFESAFQFISKDYKLNLK